MRRSTPSRWRLRTTASSATSGFHTTAAWRIDMARVGYRKSTVSVRRYAAHLLQCWSEPSLKAHVLLAYTHAYCAAMPHLADQRRVSLKTALHVVDFYPFSATEKPQIYITSCALSNSLSEYCAPRSVQQYSRSPRGSPITLNVTWL